MTVDVLGQQAQLRLDLKANATTPGKIGGGIAFECKTPPFIEGCYCLMHDLNRRDPAVTTTLETDVYDAANIVGGAAGAVVPQWISVTAPTIQLHSAMQVTAINAGKAYNVFVESRLDYTPGIVIVDPPDLKNVPLPPPINVVTIPIGPFPFSLGGPVTSVHRAEYIVGCCSWDTSLPEWDQEDGEPQDLPPRVLNVDSPEECGCGDFSVAHVRSGVVAANPLVDWKIKALEGPCRWKVVKVLREEDGTQLRRLDQGEKTEQEHAG